MRRNDINEGQYYNDNTPAEYNIVVDLNPVIIGGDVLLDLVRSGGSVGPGGHVLLRQDWHLTHFAVE